MEKVYPFENPLDDLRIVLVTASRRRLIGLRGRCLCRDLHAFEARVVLHLAKTLAGIEAQSRTLHATLRVEVLLPSNTLTAHVDAIGANVTQAHRVAIGQMIGQYISESVDAVLHIPRSASSARRSPCKASRS